MKTILSILILSLVIQANFSQSGSDIAKEWEQYKTNKVKTKICKTEYNTTESTYYDTEGKPVNKISYLSDGTKSFEMNYVYDDNNNLIREDYSMAGGDKYSITHEYDSNKNRTKTWEIEWNIEYKYDNNNILTESYDVSVGDEGQTKSIYRYDDKGQLKVIRIELGDGTKEIREHVYYDKDVIIETNFHHATNNWIAKDVYIIQRRTYYDNGLLKNITNNKETIEEYTYEYY